MRWTQAEYESYMASHNRVAVSPANMESNPKPVAKRANAGETVYPRFRIHIHSKRRRLTDPDGISAKSAIDGLVGGGLLKDDSAKEIESVTFSQEISKIEETIITIESVED